MTDWGGIALLLLPTVPSPSSKKSNREKNTNTNANRHKYLQFQFYLVSPVYQCQRVGWSTFNNYFTHKHTNETLQNTNTWKKNRTNTLVLNLPKAEGRLGSAWSRPSATNSSSDPHRDCHRHNSAAAKCTRPASSLLHHSHWASSLLHSSVLLLLPQSGVVTSQKRGRPPDHCQLSILQFLVLPTLYFPHYSL